MAQHVVAWVELGREAVASPRAHPCWPLWVPWQEEMRGRNVSGGEEGERWVSGGGRVWELEEGEGIRGEMGVGGMVGGLDVETRGAYLG